MFVLRMRLSIASSLHTLPGVVEKPIVSLELPVPFRFPFSCFHFGTPCLGRQFRLLPPFFLFAFAQPHCFRRPHYLSNRRTSLHYLMSTIETTQPPHRIPVRSCCFITNNLKVSDAVAGLVYNLSSHTTSTSGCRTRKPQELVAPAAFVLLGIFVIERAEVEPA